MTQVFEGEFSEGILIVRIGQNVGSLAEADVIDAMENLSSMAGESSLRGVVVNFSGVEYFGSLLLEVLRHLWNQVHTRNVPMVLCEVPEIGREILEISHFDRLWPIHPTCEAAVAALHVPPAEDSAAT